MTTTSNWAKPLPTAAATRNIVTTVSDNQIDFKLAKDITVDSVTAGDSKLNSDGLTISGGPSVTKSGINAAGNKITNVAAGTDDADAVNYSQLKQQSAAARTEVAAGTNIKDVVKRPAPTAKTSTPSTPKARLRAQVLTK